MHEFFRWSILVFWGVSFFSSWESFFFFRWSKVVGRFFLGWKFSRIFFGGIIWDIGDCWGMLLVGSGQKTWLTTVRKNDPQTLRIWWSKCLPGLLEVGENPMGFSSLFKVSEPKGSTGIRDRNTSSPWSNRDHKIANWKPLFEESIKILWDLYGFKEFFSWLKWVDVQNIQKSLYMFPPKAGYSEKIWTNEFIWWRVKRKGTQNTKLSTHHWKVVNQLWWCHIGFINTHQ